MDGASPGRTPVYQTVSRGRAQCSCGGIQAIGLAGSSDRRYICRSEPGRIRTPGSMISDSRGFPPFRQRAEENPVCPGGITAPDDRTVRIRLPANQRGKKHQSHRGWCFYMGTARKGEAAGLHRLRFREETYSSNVPLTITSEFRIRKRPLETTSVRFQFSSKRQAFAQAPVSTRP